MRDWSGDSGDVMSQLSFATLDFAAKKKCAKRDVFPAEMAEAVPRARLEAAIPPHYPKAGLRSRKSAEPPEGGTIIQGFGKLDVGKIVPDSRQHRSEQR